MADPEAIADEQRRADALRRAVDVARGGRLRAGAAAALRAHPGRVRGAAARAAAPVSDELTEVTMRNPIGWTLRAVAVLLLFAAVPGAPAASSATAPTRSASALLALDAPPAKCCFTNPGYTGTCEVQPA